MGQETVCRIRHSKKLSEGKVQLESGHLLVRSEDKLKIPFQSISAVKVKNGWLEISYSEGSIEIELGEAAEKWAQKISNPPSRLDKLGVKSGYKVSIQSIEDKNFADEIVQYGAALCRVVEADSDIIFFGAESKSGLSALISLKDSIQQNGAIWIIYPKGVEQITQSDVFAAIKSAGLTDIKVASFSPSHTALKAVIPSSKRGLK